MTRAPDARDLPLTVLGEIRTGLITHHASLTRKQTEQLLAPLALGEPVLSWERPIAHSLSAALVTGLDCGLAVGDTGARRVRAVGTVASRAAITGGTILQGSTMAAVQSAASGRRENWSHYTSRPGVLETLAAQPPEQLAAGFLSEGAQRDGLADFGEVCERLVRGVQKSTMLEGTAPMLFQWTRLRWAACVYADGAAAPTARLQLGEDLSRTLQVTVSHSSAEEIAEFCGDLALHDWILTTVIRRMEHLSGDGLDEDVREIRPLVARLLHLWMPAARVNTELSGLWADFERQPGFTRQWHSMVARVRDQLSLHAALQRGVLTNHNT
jgi:hypothetical protein